MSPFEIKAVVAGLSILIPLCAWFLTHRIRYTFRMKELRRQEEVEQEKQRYLSRPKGINALLQSMTWEWPHPLKWSPPQGLDGPIKYRSPFLSKPSTQIVFKGVELSSKNQRIASLRSLHQ